MGFIDNGYEISIQIYVSWCINTNRLQRLNSRMSLSSIPLFVRQVGRSHEQCGEAAVLDNSAAEPPRQATAWLISFLAG